MFLISINIYLRYGVTLVLIGQKIEVIFASTEKLDCDVIHISTTLKVRNNPVFKMVRMAVFVSWNAFNIK